jgi:FKBP-type peptidyl-prolyl cis-trans isomerase
MKFVITAALCLAVVGCQSNSGPGGSGTASLKTQIDSVSYTIGMQLGKQIKSDTTIGVKADILQAGLTDALHGSKTLLTDSQAQNVMMAFQMQMMAKQQQKMQEQHKSDSIAGIANNAAGDKFLAENKGKAGVITLPDGLQYEVIKEGTGATPKATDQVSVLYRGTLLDGTVFDSSLDASKPATFSLNQVIPGWTEALQKMKVGSKYKLYIPAKLAYGDNPPQGGKIKPGALLTFEIELLDVKGSGAAGAPGEPPAGH